MTFARFLRAQTDRTDWIGDLARGAEGDCQFPWAGSPVDMQDRLRATVRGEGDILQAFEAALEEWHGGPYPLHAERRERDSRKRAAVLVRFAAVERAEEDRKRLQRNLLAAARRRNAKSGRDGRTG